MIGRHFLGFAHVSSRGCPSHAPSTQAFEAATATLKRAGASAHELATVFRMQPDHSVRVKAMTEIGRLRTLQLEACRLQLAKVGAWAASFCMSAKSTNQFSA